MKCDRSMLLLYAVTDRAWTGKKTLLQQVEEALAGGATCIQLREKELPEGYLREFTLPDLEDRDENHYGLSGSPTQVERIFPPEKREYREIFDGIPGELADKMYHVLKEAKFI